MRVLEWLYRRSVWLNLAALIAVVLWAAWVAAIALSAPGETSSPQVHTLRACPCLAPGNANRI